MASVAGALSLSLSVVRSLRPETSLTFAPVFEDRRQDHDHQPPSANVGRSASACMVLMVLEVGNRRTPQRKIATHTWCSWSQRSKFSNLARG